MKNNIPLILISNDDGYQAKGLRALVDMLRGMGRILVCAPDSARSGYGCAFSANIPLRLLPVESDGQTEVWTSNGTPVDCVKLALDRLCGDERPDIIIGGINHGDNASVNVHYSGTMGVTLEGCMKYIPSVAFSICSYDPDADFEPLTPYVRKMVAWVLANGLPTGVCLNINFPATPVFKGVRMCRMAPGTWYDETTKEHHPRGYDYYWMVGSYREDAPEASDTDRRALNEGYVAVTPTRIDVTDYPTIGAMAHWMGDMDMEENQPTPYES